MIASVLFGIIIMIQYTEWVFCAGPLVVTDVGVIRGSRANDGNYSMFIRVPYARVNPDNVFGAALPYPPFKEIYEAVGNVSVCPQIHHLNNNFVGELDCLHVNVYVPDATNVTRPLPVMVYIYGGMFQHGSTENMMYGPKYILRHDVIFVTFNYRTGPYGFLCLDTPEVLGNQGLKDQRLALRWIQRHIASFGGDPNRVTVFGNSAGAMSIDYHLVSDSERLFRNAIMQSGNAAMVPGWIKRDESSTVLRLTALLGHQTNNISDALLFLNNVSPELVMTTYKNNKFDSMPCIESSKYPGVPTFLTNYPVNINKSWRDMSILTGVTRDETIFLLAELKDGDSNTLPARFSDILTTFNFNDALLAEVEPIIRRFYIGDEELNLRVNKSLIEFSTDFYNFHQTLRRIQNYLDNDVENIYFYLFNYEGARNYGRKRYNVTGPGVCHADELAYLYDMEYIPGPVNAPDQLMIDRMTAMWTNFAKYDNPTPQVTPLLPVKWEPITKNSVNHYFTIDSELTFNHSFFHERMSFWQLFFKAYAKYEIGFDFVQTSTVSNSLHSMFVSSLLCIVIILIVMKLLNKL